MTTEATAPPMTREQINARLREIAPPADRDTEDPALAVANAITVGAQMTWHRNMHREPFYDADWSDARKQQWAESIHAQALGFAVAHLLMAMRATDMDAARKAARFITDAWDDGQAVGEWIWSHLKHQGIDPDEVNRLEDAWQALQESEPAYTEAELTAAMRTRRYSEEHIEQLLAAIRRDRESGEPS
jgi:hypothetical protein